MIEKYVIDQQVLSLMESIDEYLKENVSNTIELINLNNALRGYAEKFSLKYE